MSMSGNTDLSLGSKASQQKIKVVTENSSAKNENSKKLADISPTPNIPHSTNPYIKTLKTEVKTIRRERNFSCTKNRTNVYKKTTVFLTPCRKQSNSARKRGSKLLFSRQNASLKHQKKRHRSLTAGHRTGKGDSISPTRDNSSCFLEQDAAPSFPKQTITTKPFLLKRRTYSCGILSVNDSPFYDGGNDIKDELDETLKQDSDYSDTFYSNENLDLLEDSKNCDVKNGATIVESTSILKVKQPIRVKYTDEISKETRELIIYSNEFLERIYEEKGKTVSKREIFESIVKQSVEYEGEELRVIRDAEEFLGSSKNAGNDQIYTRISTVTKQHSPQKSNKDVTKPPRGISSAPKWIKWWGSVEEKSDVDKWKTLDNKTHSPSPNDHFFTKNQKRRSTSNIDSLTRDSETVKLCTKPRTFLQKVNYEGIISSKFGLYFQFYSKLGGRLKSGAVISRANSHFWLKRCGVILDDATLKTANDCYTAVAKRKIVLNIHDYLQYLRAIARERRIFIMDIIQKLMSVDIDSPSISDELLKSNPLKKSISSEQKKTVNEIIKSETQHN